MSRSHPLGTILKNELYDSLPDTAYLAGFGDSRKTPAMLPLAGEELIAIIKCAAANIPSGPEGLIGHQDNIESFYSEVFQYCPSSDLEVGGEQITESPEQAKDQRISIIPYKLGRRSITN